eukprot:1157423-Pelagomonas_calceolata.AAC.7
MNCAALLPYSAEIVANLRAAHAADPNSRMGVDAVRGEAGDMAQLGIYEAFRCVCMRARKEAGVYLQKCENELGGKREQEIAGLGASCACQDAKLSGINLQASTPHLKDGCKQHTHTHTCIPTCRVKSQVLASATEAAEMILRVDEIIKAAPRRRQ